MAAMGAAAVEDFNARDGRIVPLFGSLGACDKSLFPVFFDSGSTAIDSSRVLVQNIVGGCRRRRSTDYVAIIGPARSAAAEHAAPIAGLWDLPMLSYWASASSLSSVLQYRFFGRTFPNDLVAARVMCQLWHSYGYNRAAFVYIQDASGDAFRGDVETACRPLGIALESFPFESGDGVDIRQAVRQLAASGNRVIGAQILGMHDLRDVVAAAVEFKLMGACDECHTMWSVGDGVTAVDVAALSPELRAAFHGTIFIYPSGASSSSPRWQDFATRRWGQLDADNINALLPAAFHVAADFFQSLDDESSSSARNVRAPIAISRVLRHLERPIPHMLLTHQSRVETRRLRSDLLSTTPWLRLGCWRASSRRRGHCQLTLGSSCGRGSPVATFPSMDSLATCGLTPTATATHRRRR